MAGEWEQVAFADVVELISGGTPKTSVPEYWGGSIPWLSVKDFNTGYRWVSTAEKTITEQGLAESATTILNRGDIIISARGTVGVVAQLALPMAFNQSCYGIRGRQGIAETNFVYYALRHAVSQMQQVAHGGVFNTITRDTFKIIKTKLPPLPEQRAIACILGALDDKIELNQRMNETLEAMARAIFKSCFVDFDPVRAKAEGRQPPGLAPHIADLFPDAFEESALGEIPKGWEVGVIGDIAKQALGGQWGSDSQEDGTVPAICLRGCDLEDLRSSGFAPKAPIRFVKTNAIEKRLPSKRDILIAASGAGPCGRPLWCDPRIAELYTYPVIYSNFVKRFTTPTSAHAVYLDRVLIRKFNDRTIHDYINGTSVPNLDASSLLNTCKLLIPPDDVLQAFYEFCQPVFQRLYTGQNVVLAHLRDTLLPRLISGELRVSDAERIVGRVL